MSDPKWVGWKDQDGNDLYETSTDIVEFVLKTAPTFLVMLAVIFLVWWFR